jgi:hypothetical protein
MHWHCQGRQGEIGVSSPRGTIDDELVYYYQYLKRNSPPLQIAITCDRIFHVYLEFDGGEYSLQDFG